MKKTTFEKTEESYSGIIGTSDYDTYEITKSIENGNIKVNFYDERWRTPEETINVLMELIGVIKKNF